MGFMEGLYTSVNGIEGCRVTRCGYTGEDGFEIGIPGANSVSVMEALIADSAYI
jgi:aminomethyltransferase